MMRKEQSITCILCTGETKYFQYLRPSTVSPVSPVLSRFYTCELYKLCGMNRTIFWGAVYLQKTILGYLQKDRSDWTSYLQNEKNTTLYVQKSFYFVNDHMSYLQNIQHIYIWAYAVFRIKARRQKRNHRPSSENLNVCLWCTQAYFCLTTGFLKMECHHFLEKPVRNFLEIA